MAQDPTRPQPARLKIGVDVGLRNLGIAVFNPAVSEARIITVALPEYVNQRMPYKDIIVLFHRAFVEDRSGLLDMLLDWRHEVFIEQPSLRPGSFIGMPLWGFVFYVDARRLDAGGRETIKVSPNKVSELFDLRGKSSDPRVRYREKKANAVARTEEAVAHGCIGGLTVHQAAVLNFPWTVRVFPAIATIPTHVKHPGGHRSATGIQKESAKTDDCADALLVLCTGIVVKSGQVGEVSNRRQGEERI